MNNGLYAVQSKTQGNSNLFESPWFNDVITANLCQLNKGTERPAL